MVFEHVVPCAVAGALQDAGHQELPRAAARLVRGTSTALVFGAILSHRWEPFEDSNPGMCPLKYPNPILARWSWKTPSSSQV
jgi:hypothetical protein